MPEPTCISCGDAESTLWRIGANGQICRNCSRLPMFFEDLHSPNIGEYSDYVMYQNMPIMKGAILSVEDGRGITHYAQVRGFLIDNTNECTAFVSWLLPTENSPCPEMGFHPFTYIFGSDDNTPCKLKYMRFIMQLPIDFYKNNAQLLIQANQHNIYENYLWRLQNPDEEMNNM